MLLLSTSDMVMLVSINNNDIGRMAFQTTENISEKFIVDN